MELNSMIRPEVKSFQPYLPGKPIEEVQRELGLKKVIKIASNENALGSSPLAVKALKSNCENSYRYPDGSGLELRRALAKVWKVNSSEIILGAGSDEIIELIGKTFFNPEDEVVVSAHAFIRYQMAAELLGAKTVTVPMKEDKHDLASMARAIGPKTKALFIANPNNPTGTYVTQNEVNFFLSLIPKNGANPLIIFDEAYYEYSKELAKDYSNTLPFFRERPNVIILRTFSKIYGLAGLRVGYGIAHREIVEILDRVRPPFNVSSPAQRAAIAALADKAHVKRSVAQVKRGMKVLVRELEKLGLESLPSCANFLLVSFFPRRGQEIFQALLRKGVIVRSVEEYGYPNHVRVTIGTDAENKFFLEKLKEVLNSK